MKPRAKQLIQEQTELSDKIYALTKYVEGRHYHQLSGTERELVYKQLITMRKYSDLLLARLTIGSEK